MEDQGKQPFYEAQPNIDTGTNPDGTPAHPNFIADKNAAEKVAYIQKDQGQEAALALEAMLKLENDTGLSSNEHAYISIMKGLVAEDKYPNAFDMRTDKKNRPLLILKDDDINRVIMISQRGVFRMQPSGSGSDYRNFDLTPFLDLNNKYVGAECQHIKNPTQKEYIQGSLIDINEPQNRSTLKNAFEKVQEYQKTHPPENTSKPTLDPDSLLKDL